MKKILSIITGIGVAVLAAEAQMPINMVSSPTTNALNFSTTSPNGATNVAAAGTLIVNSQPFYIWRGRGFSFTEAATPASSTTEGITNVFQFATVTGPLGAPGTLTNWLNSPLLPAAFLFQGSGRQLFSTNFTATQVDNYALGRLMAVTNLGTVVFSLDPTNTYTSVSP